MSVAEYMAGWLRGAEGMLPEVSARLAGTNPDWTRGVADGYAASEAAERAEKEREDEVCCLCGGTGTFVDEREEWQGCRYCHGTGRRA